jgi:predicted RNA binding protein YcfA (HicA-like mRNA interferase family)
MKKVTIDGAIGCVIPMHKEIALGTLHNILKQAHITVDEFAEHL